METIVRVTKPICLKGVIKYRHPWSLKIPPLIEITAEGSYWAGFKCLGPKVSDFNVSGVEFWTLLPIIHMGECLNLKRLGLPVRIVERDKVVWIIGYVIIGPTVKYYVTQEEKETILGEIEGNYKVINI